jgi:hypothetical protein
MALEIRQPVHCGESLWTAERLRRPYRANLTPYARRAIKKGGRPGRL